MKNQISSFSSSYGPQTYKNFEGALYAFFENECPQIGGAKIRQVLVSSIKGMIDKFYPSSERLAPGQTPWVTVDKNEKVSYGKKMKDTKMTTVYLDLVQAQDAADRANGMKLRDIKKNAVARLCTQSFEQGGVLTGAELSLLLKISPSTVSKYILEWEAEHGEILPTRGSIHDMGPTLTHKKIIIDKLFIQYKTVQQTSRETHHSIPAIQRYISTFRQVLLCKQKGMTTKEISFAVKITPKLVQEYEKILEEYASQNIVISELLKYEPHIENNIEIFANEYGKEAKQ